LRWLDFLQEAEHAAALYNGHFPLDDVTIDRALVMKITGLTKEDLQQIQRG